MKEMLDQLEHIQDTTPLCATCAKTLQPMYHGSKLYCSITKCPIHLAIEDIRYRLTHPNWRTPRKVQHEHSVTRAPNAPELPGESFMQRIVDVASFLVLGIAKSAEPSTRSRRSLPRNSPLRRRRQPRRGVVNTPTPRRHSRMS